MSKKFDVVAITGTYQDREGNEKPRYLNIGAVIQKKNGKFALKLEAIPTEWNGWAELFEPKPRAQVLQVGDQGEPVPLPDEDFDDKIPF